MSHQEIPIDSCNQFLINNLHIGSSSSPDELDSSRSQIEMKFIERSSQANRRARALAIPTTNAKPIRSTGLACPCLCDSGMDAVATTRLTLIEASEEGL